MTSEAIRNAPLAPVLRGKVSGVRGFAGENKPPHPNPCPPSRGEGLSAMFPCRNRHGAGLGLGVLAPAAAVKGALGGGGTAT
jgi:hypothetical protein